MNVKSNEVKGGMHARKKRRESGLRYISKRIVTGAFISGLALANALFYPVEDRSNYSGNEGNYSLRFNLVGGKEAEKDEAYNSIRQVFIKDYLMDYLNSTKHASKTFRDVEKKYGGLEQAAEEYAAGHEPWLKLAYSSFISGKSPKEEEYECAAIEVGNVQTRIASGVNKINYNSPRVVQSFIDGGKNETDFFLRLLKASKKLGSPRLNDISQQRAFAVQCLRDAFKDQQSFIDYNEKVTKLAKTTFDNMAGTLSGLDALGVGLNEIGLAGATEKFYAGYHKQFYGKNGK